MDILTNQNDINYMVAEETGLSKKQVDYIIKNFWDSIRYYLTHPLEAKAGILINGWGSFYMNIFNLKKYKKHIETNEDSNVTDKVNFLNEMIKRYGKER